MITVGLAFYELDLVVGAFKLTGMDGVPAMTHNAEEMSEQEFAEFADLRIVDGMRHFDPASQCFGSPAGADVGPEMFQFVSQDEQCGYSDVYPITGWGKFISSLIALMGIGLVALPTGVISAGFISRIEKQKKKSITACPHCGKDILING